ncbi:adenosine kinase [Elasticomyces elasticus]|uniref:Adenosine kinase n=1 Tax=Exophiala sideris TaxID=1016849 RepID=A0ABR0JEK6_9EURO|nr:adenosine kinase [Elasticomyces elasticus]KAK5032867.1 adenosine kinase [Exophiala sideris]KAK5062391.1 adenosine kinase [Exophiala sideris]KAK5177549.1 adenosine kinase [Eurotiomycetes sp. CCFEE 6388]
MSTPKFKLLCLENPLLDIQGKGDEAMLKQYSLKLDDTLLAEDHQMGLYEDLIKNHNAKLIPGGAAQNTARGAQYMLPPKSLWYIGCVGDDEYAKTLREKCAEQGLHVEYSVDSTTPTGKCGVVITGHHRTMLTHLAAANNYKIDHLQQPHIWSMVENTDIFYVGGYHLTVSPPAAMALAKHAAEKNKIFMLSLSAGFIPQFFKDPLAEILPYCDYVFGNENEAKTWAETQGHADISIPECAKLLAKTTKVNTKRPRVVIITQGTDPTIVAVAEEGQEVDIKEYSVPVIESNLINDTNGAGDAFAGGFCAGVVEGDSLELCIKKGQWLARLGLQELGPSYPYPKQTFKG